MLAYVFWHWPQPAVNRESYVDRLIVFHRTLSANKSTGFQRSVVFAIRAAPWLETDGEVFEEWYLLNDSAAMDKMNDAAVSGNCEEPHNRVARDAAGGIGGLYRLRAGQQSLSDVRFATWIEKPVGVKYPEFYSALNQLSSAPGTALWGRQMTLGPTREFCVHSPDKVQLPDGYEGLILPLAVIWAGQ